MLKKIRRPIMINGVKTWISADTEQEYAEKLLQMFGCGNAAPKVIGHDFEQYAWNWYNIFSKPNVSYVTGLTYRRQLEHHILPLFKDKLVEEITTADIQTFFNNMGG